MSDQQICVIGNQHNIYTRMVLYYLKEREQHSVAFVDVSQTTGSVGFVQRVWRVINGNPYRQLSWLDPLRWKKLLRKIWFRRTDIYKSMTASFRLPMEQLLGDSEWVHLQKLNSERALNYFRNKRFKVGLLAGLDIIVPADIVNEFGLQCLNAHPAPLPECRGGGALEQTLAKGLQPAVSVHVVTEEIDAGEVLAKEEVSVDSSDHFDALRLKLDIHRSQLLVQTAEKLLSGQEINGLANEGPLHRWKDCTREIQAQAERYLRKLRED